MPHKVVGVFLIVAGNLIVLWRKQKLDFSKGLQMIILASFLFVTGSFVDKFMVTDILSPALYKSAIFFLASFWVFVLVPKRVARIKKELRLQKQAVIIAGGLLGLSLYFLVKGFQTGEASRVLPISSFSLIFSVLGGIFFLREKERMKQKILGAIVAFAGMFLLRFF